MRSSDMFSFYSALNAGYFSVFLVSIFCAVESGIGCQLQFADELLSSNHVISSDDSEEKVRMQCTILNEGIFATVVSAKWTLNGEDVYEWSNTQGTSFIGSWILDGSVAIDHLFSAESGLILTIFVPLAGFSEEAVNELTFSAVMTSNVQLEEFNFNLSILEYNHAFLFCVDI